MARLNFLLYVLFVTLNLLSTISNAGCPFAAMMNNYNFTGDWSYNVSTDGKIAYVMHICHFDNHEMYFTLAKNDTPDVIIGFGAGNWSQTSMMIGGQLYEINNGTSEPHGFGVGMNMEIHKWWLQDPMRSTEFDENAKSESFDKKICAIPFGIDIRREYWQTFWDTKRKFHRQQRIKKRVKDRERKRRLRAEKKKPQYIKYYEQFLDFIGFGEEVDDTISDEELTTKFVYDEKPNFPSLYGQTWINNEQNLQFTLIDEKNGCFNGESLSNITIAYFGVGINSYIEKENGIRNGQFFVQIDQNQVIGSSIKFKLDDNGDIVEDEIKQFTMEKSDKLIPCPNTKVPIQTDTEKENECQTSDGTKKCEL
eukprot:CAMPEP_0201565282 /NCGR_PEP_ID=MMETSP0190_2-20130828/4286_1 /ASSEMBLY_ACC=CAM_ASM_000263 /TAXON_ID=37353 /ORGANISM="Rosalina sp." /LENGTH=365 /DNA_ID=CAMNT_0047982599 /DNA_START=21 /DNA_END=1118 /DNA_ORIENTATION=+